MTTDTTVSVKDRIPASLAKQAIFTEFLSKILEAYDEISAYNDKVLGSKDSEWNSYKVLDKARDMARPASGEPNTVVKEALEAYENLVSEVNRAKQAVIQVAASELGIDFAVGNERDPEVEAPLKEKRKVAINIGDQLLQIASITADPKLTSDIKDFLAKYEMPAVGRNQAHTFSLEGGSGAPKYRVKVSVSRDDELLFEADGFTKTAQALPKYYERGKAPSAETLRTAWERAGNSMKETVKPTVEFVDGDLVFTITKK